LKGLQIIYLRTFTGSFGFAIQKLFYKGFVILCVFLWITNPQLYHFGIIDPEEQ